MIGKKWLHVVEEVVKANSIPLGRIPDVTEYPGFRFLALPFREDSNTITQAFIDRFITSNPRSPLMLHCDLYYIRIMSQSETDGSIPIALREVDSILGGVDGMGFIPDTGNCGSTDRMVVLTPSRPESHVGKSMYIYLACIS